MCILINEKSEGSIAKYLRCDGSLCYKFIIRFASERIFRIGEHLAKLRTNWVISCLPFALRLLFVLKDTELVR